MTQHGQMTAATRQIDDAAFGVVYGSITVMSVLMGMHPPIEAPGQQALILFGSVFAVAAFGLVASDTAIVLAQALVIALLGCFGAPCYPCEIHTALMIHPQGP